MYGSLMRRPQWLSTNHDARPRVELARKLRSTTSAPSWTVRDRFRRVARVFLVRHENAPDATRESCAGTTRESRYEMNMVG